MQLYNTVDKHGYATFLETPHDNIAEINCKASMSLEEKVETITLLYTDSYRTTCDNSMYEESVHNEKSRRSMLQRIVASSLFSEGNKRRHSVLVVENDQNAYKIILDNCFFSWFANALCFLMLQVPPKKRRATKRRR